MHLSINITCHKLITCNIFPQYHSLHHLSTKKFFCKSEILCHLELWWTEFSIFLINIILVENNFYILLGVSLTIHRKMILAFIWTKDHPIRPFCCVICKSMRHVKKYKQKFIRFYNWSNMGDWSSSSFIDVKW